MTQSSTKSTSYIADRIKNTSNTAFSADALSIILETLRLKGGCFGRPTFKAPWGIAYSHNAIAGCTCCDDIAAFHAIIRGQATITVAGQTTHLCEGDIVYLRNAQDHSLKNDENAPCIPAAEALFKTDDGQMGHCFGNNTGPETTLVSGVVRYPHPPSIHPMLSILPEIIILQRPPGGGRQIDHVLSYLAGESHSQRVAADALVVRLCEILFIELIRYAVENRITISPSWIGGLQDDRLNRALMAIHATPQTPWSVGSLARIAGMSRTSFSRHFSAQVGEPPLTYLTRWRMQLGATKLKESDSKLISVAQSVGYESEAAFSRAFSKLVGVSPGAYRRNTQANPDVS